MSDQETRLIDYHTAHRAQLGSYTKCYHLPDGTKWYVPLGRYRRSLLTEEGIVRAGPENSHLKLIGFKTEQAAEDGFREGILLTKAQNRLEGAKDEWWLDDV